MNVIEPLEFELSFFDVADQKVSHNENRIPLFITFMNTEKHMTVPSFFF